MPKLPNPERAEVAIEKLRDYALNPLHDEGKHKARVFRGALGFAKEDAERLRELILEAAQEGEATKGKLLPEGQIYVLDFSTEGQQGQVVIRTAWIVELGKDFPRLVTCYARKPR
ncbi:MAG: DUF6883 domain-containing protein [Pyrinomonadaceae bacterium]